MAQDTLTITDNRTNQTYNFPIAKETVRAMDFRQIKASPEDFGLMAYDPAFMNTASCRSSIHDYPRADRLWVVANQADEVVVLDKTGKTVAKLGDFNGLDEQGAPRGLLFPAEMTKIGDYLYVENLSVDVRFFKGTTPSRAVRLPNR